MTTEHIIMLAIVAFIIVVSLAVSLIAITLRNIREDGGQTPQWPVSWPEPPAELPQQQVKVPHQRRASLPRVRSRQSH